MGHAGEKIAISKAPAQEEGLPPNLRQRMLISLIGQVFLSILGIGIVGPVLPLYARSFGVSVALAGSLVTAFGLARLFSNLPAGQLADRIGCRPLLVGGMALTALTALLAGLSSVFPLLLLCRFFQGIGSAIQNTGAMIALTDISTPQNRGRIMSIYMGSLLIGSSLGPTVGGFVGQQWGFRAPFFAYALLALVGTLWAYFMAPETHCKGASDSRMGRGKGSLLKGLNLLLQNGSFVTISLVSMVTFATRSGSRSTVLPLYGDSLGLSTSQIGIILTIIALANLATVHPAGVLADRLGRKMVIVPASLLCAAALFLFPHSGTRYPTILLASIFWGISTGLLGPTPAAYVADIASAGQSGTTMGLFRTFGDVGLTLGPLLMGALSDAFGYTWAFYVNAMLFALVGILFGLIAQQTAEPLTLPTQKRKAV